MCFFDPLLPSTLAVFLAQSLSGQAQSCRKPPGTHRVSWFCPPLDWRLLHYATLCADISTLSSTSSRNWRLIAAVVGKQESQDNNLIFFFNVKSIPVLVIDKDNITLREIIYTCMTNNDVFVEIIVFTEIHFYTSHFYAPLSVLAFSTAVLLCPFPQVKPTKNYPQHVTGFFSSTKEIRNRNSQNRNSKSGFFALFSSVLPPSL